MSERLFFIDVDGTTTEICETNDYYWRYPLGGNLERKEDAEFRELLHPRYQMLLGSNQKLVILKPVFGIRGDDRADVMTHLESFLWLTDPERGNAGGGFTLKRVTDAGDVFQTEAVRIAYKANERQFLKRNLTLLQVDLALALAYGGWYNPTEATASGAFNGTTETTIAIPGGTLPGHGVVTITNAVSQPRIENSDGDYIEFEDDLVAGDVLTVDFRPDEDTFGATLSPAGGGADVDWTHRRSVGSTWFRFPAGSGAQLALTADSGTATVAVAYRKWYKVVA